MKHYLVIPQLLIIIILVFFAALFFTYFHFFKAGEVMVASMSSDGNYAITTDFSRKAILWNLKNHTKKIIDRNANIYSAYFIKNSNNFMWQHDSDNTVIIENTVGQIIKKFNPGFPTYGEIITNDLKTYLASDENWNIYLLTLNNNIQKTFLKKYHFTPDFIGAGKLINLTLFPNDNYLLSSGLADNDEPLSKGSAVEDKDHFRRSLLAGVVLWDTETKKPIQKYFGNIYKTFATFSPDGKYVVAGDENGQGFIWMTVNGKRIFHLYSLEFGYIVNPEAPIEKQKWNDDGLIKQPKDFQTYNEIASDTIFTIKFIDDQYYLRINTYVPNYAILYSVTDPKPLKYLPLGHSPMISVDDYTRDQSIDTSPEAHILVTGKINHGGILVYQYDPKTQTLTKIWNGR